MEVSLGPDSLHRATPYLYNDTRSYFYKSTIRTYKLEEEKEAIRE